MNNTTQTAIQDNSQVQSVLKLGLDVDLRQITVTVQYDHQHPKPAQSFNATRLVTWVRQKVQAGHVVHTVYESCGFGYQGLEPIPQFTNARASRARRFGYQSSNYPEAGKIPLSP
jgi:hypothetical protein